MTSQAEPVKSALIPVIDLLSDPSLTIPEYQRPYKWTRDHVSQLFSDISDHLHKSCYRLGTIVFHEEKVDGKPIIKNIVDGQQRTLTLLLAAHAIKEAIPTELNRKDLKEKLNHLKLVDPPFTNAISRSNIRQNYLEILKIVNQPDFTEEHIDFLLHKCWFVTVTLRDISEAFQFFDSHNARGRELKPHDLLKAYHIHEFSDEDAHLKQETVSHWENAKIEEADKNKDIAQTKTDKALEVLFGDYLYRIRKWSLGESARQFTKHDVGFFKGVTLDTIERYPHIAQLRMVHFFVDNYNAQAERKFDRQHTRFPFQLDQKIINGRRFFEMTSHYLDKVRQIRGKDLRKHIDNAGGSLSKNAARILETLNRYDGRDQTGDRYVRLMFNCLLIYYIDKFGYAEISTAIEKVFFWAYRLRLTNSRVGIPSVDNYVLRNNLFKTIRDAVFPSEFNKISLPFLGEQEVTYHRRECLVKVFEKLGFFAQATPAE